MNDTSTTVTEADITPPLFKYGLLALGLLLALLAGFVMEWKRTSARDAAGDVKEIQAEISGLLEDAKEATTSSAKKDLEEKAKKLTEEELKEAQKESRGEEIDAEDGIWFYSMTRYIGFAVMALGLLVVIGVGNNYERAGGLIALGFIVTQMK